MSCGCCSSMYFWAPSIQLAMMLSANGVGSINVGLIKRSQRRYHCARLQAASLLLWLVLALLEG